MLCLPAVFSDRFAQFSNVARLGPPKRACEVGIAVGVVVVCNLRELLLGQPIRTNAIDLLQFGKASLPCDHVEENHGPAPQLVDEGWVAASLGVSVQVGCILVLACLVHLGQGRLLPSVGSGYYDLDEYGWLMVVWRMANKDVLKFDAIFAMKAVEFLNYALLIHDILQAEQWEAEKAGRR